MSRFRPGPRAAVKMTASTGYPVQTQLSLRPRNPGRNADWAWPTCAPAARRRRAPASCRRKITDVLTVTESPPAATPGGDRSKTQRLERSPIPEGVPSPLIGEGSWGGNENHRGLKPRRAPPSAKGPRPRFRPIAERPSLPLPRPRARKCAPPKPRARARRCRR